MPMKIKVQDFMDATLILSKIIREDRRLPTKGKHKIGRLHAAMQPEFIRINAVRDDIIKSYGFTMEVPNPDWNPSVETRRQKMVTDGNLKDIVKLPPKMITTPAVPEDKGEDFEAKWGAIANSELELNANPIHIDDLCYPGDLEDGSITAHEFIKLGDLITE